MAGKLPYFAFYPSDWLGAGTLRRASHATKGFYIDLLCVMHDCDNRGKLEANGTAWTEEEIARSINGDPAENLSHLRWLVTHGILSRDENGTIFSRRMVKDEVKRMKGSENGKKGGGNPQLAKNSKKFTQIEAPIKVSPKGGLYSYSRDHIPYSKDQNSEPEPETRFQLSNTPPNPPSGGNCGADGSADVLEVFGHYRTHHPRAFINPQSDSKEWKAIKARIRDGYSVQDLKDAIDGCHVCPHNCGENERGQKYQALSLIVRDGDQVNRFIEELHNRGSPVLSQRSLKNNRAAESFLERMRGKNENR